MRVLALDQASRISGYSVFDGKQLIASGTIPLADDELGVRLMRLRQKVIELFNKFDIEFILLEDIQYQNNAETHKILGEVLGTLEELAVELVGTNYEVVPSVRWKSGLSIKGQKRAEQKKNAAKYVVDTYGKKVTQDEADAICIGSYYVNRIVGFNWGE